WLLGAVSNVSQIGSCILAEIVVFLTVYQSVLPDVFLYLYPNQPWHSSSIF
ncbi:MAG: hypothetical protein RLZZ203_2282, partial [Cyanobacteriota bacterium]